MGADAAFAPRALRRPGQADGGLPRLRLRSARMRRAAGRAARRRRRGPAARRPRRAARGAAGAGAGAGAAQPRRGAGADPRSAQLAAGDAARRADERRQPRRPRAPHGVRPRRPGRAAALLSVVGAAGRGNVCARTNSKGPETSPLEDPRWRSRSSAQTTPRRSVRSSPRPHRPLRPGRRRCSASARRGRARRRPRAARR